MALTDDQIALAAEYALGTLDADERARVEDEIAVDSEFGRAVDAWQYKLGVLNQMVGLVEPRPEVWDRIREALGLPAQPRPFEQGPSGDGDDAPTAPVSTAPSSKAPSSTAPSSKAPEPARVAEPFLAAPTSERTVFTPVLRLGSTDNVVEMSRRVRRWRGLALASSAIAAALLVTFSLQSYRPELLPAPLRPKVVVVKQTAEATPAPATGMPTQYVALLQRDATSPAFILTVDSATKMFSVRKVDAATEPGRSYELWIVSDKLQKPRSLGVIGGHDFTLRTALSSYDADVVNKATYAVTMEPEGGSPTGSATGPVVYSGRLIETVPNMPPAR